MQYRYITMVKRVKVARTTTAEKSIFSILDESYKNFINGVLY